MSDRSPRAIALGLLETLANICRAENEGSGMSDEGADMMTVAFGEVSELLGALPDNASGTDDESEADNDSA